MKNIVQSTFQVIFVVLAVILVNFITLGIQQDFTRLCTTEFWVEVSAQLLITMIIFNIARAIDKRQRAHDKSSRFFKAYATNHLRIKEIEKNKLYTELDQAVAKKNQEYLIAKCNKKLHAVCTRVNYEDVVGEDSIEELILKFKVFKKRENKFTKLVEKIRGGSIRIKPLSADVFLRDKEVLFDKAEKYDYSNIIIELKDNTQKAFTFLAVSIITSTLSFSFVSPNFWSTLVTNLTLMIGATISGFSSSIKDIKQKTALYETRNRFLHKYLDISVEYSEGTEHENISHQSHL